MIATHTFLALLSRIRPTVKASVFNEDLPAADSDILAADIILSNPPGFFRIYWTAAVEGLLKVTRTVGEVTITEILNSSNVLVADSAYMFTVQAFDGDSLNLQFSATGAKLLSLRIVEIGGAE